MPKSDNIKEIPEFKSTIFDELDPETDLPYLKKSYFGSESPGTYKVRELKDSKVEIENTSYSGIIQLDTVRLHFSTKVKTNLFYMLSFLKDEKFFLYDPEVVIEIKEGENFFDILGRLFLNELEEIFRRGIYKKYVRKEENIAFLRGKLCITGQVTNDIRKRAKFHCSYEDLTYDNQENRIVLRATHLLIPLIRFNEDIKRSLMRYSQLLREEVSLVDLTYEDCNRIQFSKLNEHYESIIQFAKVILQHYFIRSVHVGASRGFNFIVNMNKVYEDFITALIEEVIEEGAEFKDFAAEKQERFDSLVKEKRIITRPDVILRQKNKKDYPVIIDAKYKRYDNNADYYQVIAYALAIPSARACFLIYPADELVDESPLTIDPKVFGNQRPEIKIFCIRINLLWEESYGFADYVNLVKKQLSEKLSKVIEHG
jgi:5-methylcytosine-specific restriction enzyme subunit McrC